MSDPGAAPWSPAPMSALRAFESAARLLSFTSAAAELGVTQSAVSHSIRELELRLSVGLFRRDGRRLELTDAGRRYAPFVRDALARLKAGDLAIVDPARRARVLTVSVSPSFAAKWLAPRIGEFAALHPDLDLRISANPQHIDFADGEIDFAIRHGEGGWPSLSCTRLCTEAWLPVCSRAIAPAPLRAEDLLHLPLIHHRDGSGWRRWFATAGADWREDEGRGLTFNEMSHGIDAAVAGQGIALARSALAARDLIAGRLVCPTGAGEPAEIAYWIVRPKDRARNRNFLRLKEWLLKEAAAEEEALSAALRRG